MTTQVLTNGRTVTSDRKRPYYVRTYGPGREDRWFGSLKTARAYARGRKADIFFEHAAGCGYHLGGTP